MVQVMLGVGSNERRFTHVTIALDALADKFGELRVSPVYESEAIGFDGEHFLNLVVGVDTLMTPGQLSHYLKSLEDAQGRVRAALKYSARTLDIDVLTYGDLVGLVDGIELPRAEILTNAFVLRPLADLAPDAMHPRLQRSYRELWAEYDQPQRLWPVPFHWRGRVLAAEQQSFQT